jgi:hypothetical protein
MARGINFHKLIIKIHFVYKKICNKRNYPVKLLLFFNLPGSLFFDANIKDNLE